jgi:hypothetical protein
LNTDETSEVSASDDFYLAIMYKMCGFSKEEMQSKIHWWIMRNEGMCHNIIKRAKKVRAKKLVVIAAADDRKYMQDIGRVMQDVKVMNINEVN